jgi:zinc D-Ala-D-Ala carboxypeptidase
MQNRFSPHFSYAEMITSPTAERLSIKNVPDFKAKLNLKALCLNILEPIRDVFGPVLVSSGFRSVALNSVIGGAVNSQHIQGEAADIIVPNAAIDEVFEWICNSNMPFDQVIHEFGRWIHISHKRNEISNRREILVATRDKNNETVYTKYHAEAIRQKNYERQ